MRSIIGVDISKDRLDVFALADRTYHQFANDQHGIRALIRQFGTLDQPLVVFEATGAYHRRLEASLAEHAVHFNKINPRQSRRFAEATGRLAKTDRVDAAMLARMAAALSLPPQTPKGLHQCRASLANGRARSTSEAADANCDARSICRRSPPCASIPI
jgi:transposase